MNNQQKQFQRTHTTNTNTLNEIVQKAMGTHTEQVTRINKGQSNEVYFIDLKDGPFVFALRTDLTTIYLPLNDGR